MTMRLLAFATLSVAALGCTQPTSVSAPVPRGKPTAPVAVSAELSQRSARVLLRFEADAERVKVTVSGNDGLTVESAPVALESGSFKKGDTRELDVAFSPAAGRSQLVVAVAGRFNGGSRARTVAFTVGSGPAAESPGEVMTTSDGERVKLLPAGP